MSDDITLTVTDAGEIELDVQTGVGGPAPAGTGFVKVNNGVLETPASAIAQSVITNLVTDLAAKAPLASPALTGTPTVPTANPGTNTTQAANTAFVAAAIAALVNSSPAALDTLVELATALGNDANFATTVTNALAGKAASVHTHAQSDVTNLVSDLALKAPLASPALTGTPTVPTATGGTNTTQAASTAFVVAAVAAAVTGLLEFISDLDCSGSPNYPAGNKGDTYYVSAAGRVGGGSGKSVAVGDAVVCKADNAGGTEASVGTSWFVLEKNLAGALLSANNLSDVASAATALSNIGGHPLSTNLAAIDTAYNGGGGVLVETGDETYNKRLVGAANSTDLIDRAAGDGRYARRTYTTQQFTGNGTWTKPADLVRVKVTVVGAGGGGGGSGTAALVSGQCGGGGGVAHKWIAAASLGTTETVTIGAGGTAGSAGANAGGNGGSTSFGAHAVATGGSGGQHGDSNNLLGAGGAGTTGDLLLTGGRGGGSGTQNNYSGHRSGEAPGFGGGVIVQLDTTGLAGASYGAGGAAGNKNGTNRAGGAGAAGFVIVEEFY